MENNYELIQIDAWADGDGGWTYNESWKLEDVSVAEGSETDYLLSLIQDKFRDNYAVERDCDVFELVEKDTRRPIMALIIK